MKNWYQLTESETLDKLGVTSEGLSSQQADSLLENTEKMCLKKDKRNLFSGVFKSVCRPYGNNPYNCGNCFNVSGSVESTIVILR